jgi:CDP-6-deoxy-D-xylo-4-hexulose-3-dehydrase
MKKLSVPYAKPVHDEKEIAAVLNVLNTSTQMGKHVNQFENAISDLFLKEHGIMVNSGSSANYLAVEILELEPGDEVITPVLTFSTTVAPLIKNNLLPAFVDVELDTYNIDINQIEEMITPKTRALLIPSLFGNTSDLSCLKDIAKQHQLFFIEDSADTLGATFDDKPTGYYSDISTTSFYGTHIINCAGNGGMLCVNSLELSQRAKLLRSWGRSSSLFEDSESISNRFENAKLDHIDYDNKFIFEKIGYNLEPSEIGAAYGLVQLERLSTIKQKRQHWFHEHSLFFRDYENWFILPRQHPHLNTAWMHYPLIVKDDAPFTRTELQIHLETHGIQTRPAFTGNILRQPGFKDMPCQKNQSGYPNADQITKGSILLGCHHGLTTEQVHHIYDVCKAFFSTH